MASLKASKQVAHAPSKVEVLLSDSQKLSYAPMISLVSKAYGLELEHESLTQLKGKANFAFAESFVNLVRDNELSYDSYQALKKHTIQSIATAKHIQFDSVEKWFNPIVKGYIKNDLADGYELPKAESKSAQGMAKLRGELASIETDALQALIEQSAKAGDFKKASQLATEKTKREKAQAREVSKAESKNTTELKGALKRWIGGADSDLLAALLWVKNHQAQVIKLSKA